ncbi:ATP-binding protein [Nocardiopsis sp. ATB16-24]|uniref:ATP-binding protein n=1 Tax=Nocardiopsis sp. ATB16-24 TaxID=3019555 RepID=UPI002554C21C|nr:ATP-binding protein [Nocardiopsis sp. ATB16-24]
MLALSHDQTLLWKGRTSFPGVVEAVGDARAWVTARLIDQGIEPPESLTLVLSELATNAIAHTRSGTAGGQFAVRTLIYSDHIRVEVRDGGPFENTHPLHPSVPELLAEHGRGLVLVDALACSWGRLTNGRGVFAEVLR